MPRSPTGAVISLDLDVPSHSSTPPQRTSPIRLITQSSSTTCRVLQSCLPRNFRRTKAILIVFGCTQLFRLMLLSLSVKLKATMLTKRLMTCLDGYQTLSVEVQPLKLSSTRHPCHGKSEAGVVACGKEGRDYWETEQGLYWRILRSASYY